MVVNPRYRIKKYVIGVSILVDKECHTTMLLNYMDIYRLMDNAEQIEESKIREISQENKRPTSDECSHKKPKKRFYN